MYLGSAVAGLALLLGNCPSNLTSPAYNANEKVGLPTVAAGMNIDGIANEAAWSKSSRIFLEDGASVSAAFMRGMADANNIYLYFEAEDTGFDNFDTVVLAFNPSGANGDFHRLNIFPCKLVGGGTCPGGGSDPNGLNPIVESTTGTLGANGEITWSPLTTGGPPTNILVESNVAPNGLANRWSVEVQIPRNVAPYAFAPANFWGMFVDVISTDINAATAAQYSWPLGTFIGSDPNNRTNPNNVFGGSVQEPLMKPNRWGNVTLDTTNFPAGLQVTGLSNIGLDPSAISRTQPNDFTGTIANYPNGTGNEPDASGVRARFKINNIGLDVNQPSAWTWTDIPVGNNPTPFPPAAGQTIKAREYMPFSPDEWSLSASNIWPGSNPPQTEHDFFTAHDHQCVMVEVSYAQGATFSRYFNMQFVETNSPFTISPEIRTGTARKLFPQARGVMLRELFLNGGQNVGHQSQFAGAEPAGEHRWIIRSLERPSEQLKTSILPADTLQLPSQNSRLDVAALSRGRHLDITVKPGTVVTLLARGEAESGQGHFGPRGMSDAMARRNEVQAERLADSLRPGMRARVGELIGSFDNFRTSFAIGAAMTMVTPPNAQQLSIRFAPGVVYDRGAIDLQAIVTPMTAAMLDGVPLQSIRESKSGALLPLGMNLPMYIVRGTLDTGLVVTISGKQFRAGVPMGSYGAFIRSVHGSGDVGPSILRRAVVARDTVQPVIR